MLEQAFAVLALSCAIGSCVTVPREGGAAPSPTEERAQTQQTPPRPEEWDCRERVQNRSGTADFSACKGSERIACYEDIEQTCRERHSSATRAVRSRRMTGRCAASYGDCWQESTGCLMLAGRLPDWLTDLGLVIHVLELVPAVAACQLGIGQNDLGIALVNAVQVMVGHDL